MSLTPELRAIMEAIALSDDGRVSARDRIDAGRVLADGGSAEPEGAAILTREVAALSDEQLARELELHFAPEVERRVRKELERRGAALDARERALDEREARFVGDGR